MLNELKVGDRVHGTVYGHTKVREWTGTVVEVKEAPRGRVSAVNVHGERVILAGDGPLVIVRDDEEVGPVSRSLGVTHTVHELCYDADGVIREGWYRTEVAR